MERNANVNFELVERFRRKNGMSKTEFCKFCKISPTSYRKFLSGDTHLRLTVVRKICLATHISLYELYGV